MPAWFILIQPYPKGPILSTNRRNEARGNVGWQDVRGPDFEVLEAHPHTRKLPRGALAGNRFAVRLRPQDGDGTRLGTLLAPRLADISRRGVPNYFGPQRFGRDGANLARTHAQLRSLRLEERGFVLSAARSVLFNAVLAARVAAGTWEHFRAGDLANLDGRGSVFAVEETDASLPARCQRLEIHPTGPLWGEGEPPTRAAVHELESGIAAQFPEPAAPSCRDARASR